MSQLVQVRIEQRGDVVLAQLGGELDIASAPGARQTVEGAVTRDMHALVVDCSELSFMDSSGLAMLFSLARRLGSRRQQLHVVAPSGDAVARILDLVEFRRAAPVYPALDDALAALGADAA